MCETCSSGHDDETILMCDGCDGGFHMVVLLKDPFCEFLKQSMLFTLYRPAWNPN